ncbi:hypothetical protein CCMSSC00406_0007834 [Pleurotus cornucopiae]|uniref:Uncharacterized protein n=1 Tax=Pleurotus cornucopiae TaxID=5321 RepID=A0ACB7J1G5_PLECO|nr:hypothetical protein CCMSSC00406_0007834 [Pleurotus cornucopiae]
MMPCLLGLFGALSQPKQKTYVRRRSDRPGSSLRTLQLHRQPPITMRVALFVLAFAAVFVLANPSGDKKKAKKTKTPPAAAAAEEPAPVDGGDAPAA